MFRVLKRLFGRPDPRPAVGECERCRSTFAYDLIHNGFADTAYAYCDRCGMTALLSGWLQIFPKVRHSASKDRLNQTPKVGSSNACVAAHFGAMHLHGVLIATRYSQRKSRRVISSTTRLARRKAGAGSGRGLACMPSSLSSAW